MPGDVDTIASIVAGAFGHAVDQDRAHIVEDMRDSRQTFYLGSVDGTIVSSLKVYEAGDRAFIYAFAVRPEVQGRGYGRAMLGTTIRRLRDDGWSVVGLEVEVTNLRAKSLYASCGFELVTTYQYFRMTV